MDTEITAAELPRWLPLTRLQLWLNGDDPVTLDDIQGHHTAIVMSDDGQKVRLKMQIESFTIEGVWPRDVVLELVEASAAFDGLEGQELEDAVNVFWPLFEDDGEQEDGSKWY